jgi:hypothetical protein
MIHEPLLSLSASAFGSAPGLIAERVLVPANISVHQDPLNSRFGYVSISRASHETTLFTDDLAKLGPQLRSRVSKNIRSGNQSGLIDRSGNWHAALIGIFHPILLA